ncbi:hypothetical protein C0J52_06252 [Blattella germanica]|nr:hypothetical protein C0J52_06252 [Blattella germanica]
MPNHCLPQQEVTISHPSAIKRIKITSSNNSECNVYFFDFDIHSPSTKGKNLPLLPVTGTFVLSTVQTGNLGTACTHHQTNVPPLPLLSYVIFRVAPKK